jgi:DMSO/TMAO reductase YedYZ molybdopterin-dependent catalytic subunit
MCLWSTTSTYKPLAKRGSAPVRVSSDLYFWKSAKWLTGIRFVAATSPVAGGPAFHSHADPWREERHNG